jgi:MFS family permease
VLPSGRQLGVGAHTHTPLNRDQIRGFWTAWAGWTLDGMDSFIYALVMVPALRELLPHSGIAATSGAIGYYGGLLFAVFLAGWGLSFLWGPVGDRIGRLRALMLTVACYSIFTLCGAMAQNVWMLAGFRLLAGIGIGGEWSLGGVYVAEAWPEDRRSRGAGYMHTGYYFGFFLAAAANYVIGARFGWRAMFLLGGVPALLVGWLRHGLREPERWRSKAKSVPFLAPLRAIFSREYRRRTALNSIYLFISIVGLWAGSVYVPASVTQLAVASGRSSAEAAQIASWGGMLLAAGTILGCFAASPLAERFGRRVTLGLYFALMAVSILLAFGYAFYLRQNALAWFISCLFALGIGGANFAVYTLWLPEQYRASCRATAFAFATSAGRFAAAGVTFLVGAGVERFHTIGTPIALTSVAFIIGLALLPFGAETKGQPLP